MLRLAGFVVLALVLASLLGRLPVVGPFFRSTGLLGIWASAILLAWGASVWSRRMLAARQDKDELRRLETVGGPRNHGKAGSLLLARGRHRAALPHLLEATEGEPDVAEWWYRLGLAQLHLRRFHDAQQSLHRAVTLDPEHAYGQTRLRLAESYQRASRPQEALDTLAAFERSHGPSPESSYRRGLALRALGRRTEARQAFRESPKLAANAPRFRKKEANAWALRAWLAGLW